MKWKLVSSLALKHEFELENDNMVRLELICEKSDIEGKMQMIFGSNNAKPIDEWYEDCGDVLWWKFPIEEPPYCGTPLDSDWKIDYYTHWTPILIPIEPMQ